MREKKVITHRVGEKEKHELKVGKNVKSSKEERQIDKKKQTKMAFTELISSPPPSTAQLMAWQ